MVTSFILLTSMSDCNKLLTELKSLEKLTVSAEINGAKFSGNTYDNDKVESDLVSVSWADSVAYILSADMTKEGQDITSAPVYYVVLRISMKVKGDLKLDKWYPLDIDNDYIYDVDAKIPKNILMSPTFNLCVGAILNLKLHKYEIFDIFGLK